MAEKQRIGILSGTFDPVCSGQIRMGRQVVDTGVLDLLLLLPCGFPPCGSCEADAEDRWKMLVSACASDQRLLPLQPDSETSGVPDAAEILSRVKLRYPKADLYCVISSDVLDTLSSWRHIRQVFRKCTFLVCTESGNTDKKPVKAKISRFADISGRFRILPVDAVPDLSPDIRNSLSSGIIPSGLDPSVAEYCRCKGLYGSPGRLEQIDFWIDSLFSSLKPKRFAHSLSVALTARRLAALYGLDQLKAEQAGLLHDCAKCIPLTEMRRIAADHSLTDDPAFLDSGSLLHSIVGAWVAENRYGMKDPDVLEAIRYHNTGHTGMSRLAMCVCLSDSIEPLRVPYPLLEEVRALSEVSLERSLLLSLERTADYVTSGGKFLHPRTRETIRWLKELPAVKESN